MDAGSEFVFLVEAQTYDEQVAPLDPVRVSPHYHGEPLLVCGECRASIEQNRQDIRERDAREEARSKLYRKILAVVGIVAVLIALAIIFTNLQ